jgi:hypothetical protein
MRLGSIFGGFVTIAVIVSLCVYLSGQSSQTITPSNHAASLPVNPAHQVKTYTNGRVATCTTCRGTSLVPCRPCYSGGRVDVLCRHCIGQGHTETLCSWCKGQDLTKQPCCSCRDEDYTTQACRHCAYKLTAKDIGYTPKYACAFCLDTGIRQACSSCSGTRKGHKCSYCEGTGTEKHACYYCRKTGKVSVCADCKGTKSSACSVCAGFGVIVLAGKPQQITATHKPPVADDGSYYGQASNLTGRSKTVYVQGYNATNGRYVKSTYRSVQSKVRGARAPPIYAARIAAKSESPLKTTEHAKTASTPQSGQNVAENGSYYGQTSTNTGRPKTVHVRGYYRKNGTYVRGHYRSRPRR